MYYKQLGVLVKPSGGAIRSQRLQAWPHRGHSHLQGGGLVAVAVSMVVAALLLGDVDAVRLHLQRLASSKGRVAIVLERAERLRHNEKLLVTLLSLPSLALLGSPGRTGHQVLPVFVSDKAWLRRPWLDAGLVLWLDTALAFERDYFLPLPAGDFSGARKVPADYVEASNMSRALFSELPEASPAVQEGKVKSMTCQAA